MRNSMPSKEKIWDYWRLRYFKGKLNGDKWSYVFEDDEKVCFACCCYGSLERCHIVSHSEGGSEDVSNLHLLCSGCHQKTEAFGKELPELYYAILEHKTLWIKEIDTILSKMILSMNEKQTELFKKK